MTVQNIIRVLNIVFPWLTVALLPKKSIREFLPVTFFASLLVTAMCILAIKRNGGLFQGN